MSRGTVPPPSASDPPAADRADVRTARILIADKLAPEGAAYLQGRPGVEVETRTGLAGR